MVEFNNVAPFQNIHEITLQGLDRWLPFGDTARVPGGKVYYGASHFTGTENTWNETPIVFVPVGKPVAHVDHSNFTRDPRAEVARLGYRIAGKLNNTRVTTGSDPKVVSEAAINDPEVSRLAAAGKLSLSTGFDVPINKDGMMSGPVSPNHILVFTKCSAETTGFCGTANDKLAAFNNTEEGNAFEQAERAEQAELKAHGDMWLIKRQIAGKPGIHDVGTVKEFTEVLRVKNEELRERDGKSRGDLIRQARGKLNIDTGRFE
jgi:hypothetical protein